MLPRPTPSQAGPGTPAPVTVHPAFWPFFRCMLRRALGGRMAPPGAAAALAVGAASGWIASRYLSAPAAGPGQLSARFFLGFPHSALYLLGLLHAWRLPGAVFEDERTGWTWQYIAAGGERSGYIIGLTAAQATAATASYALAVLGWGVTFGWFAGSRAPLLSAATLFPVAVLWLGAAAALAAALVALTARANAAQALLLSVVLLPHIAVAALLARELEDVPPDWLVWLFRLVPQYPVVLELQVAARLLLYIGVALGVAFLLSSRLLRVR